jgi:hypothetical protein
VSKLVAASFYLSGVPIMYVEVRVIAAGQPQSYDNERVHQVCNEWQEALNVARSLGDDFSSIRVRECYDDGTLCREVLVR